MEKFFKCSENYFIIQLYISTLKEECEEDRIRIVFSMDEVNTPLRVMQLEVNTIDS